MSLRDSHFSRPTISKRIPLHRPTITHIGIEMRRHGHIGNVPHNPIAHPRSLDSSTQPIGRLRHLQHVSRTVRLTIVDTGVLWGR